MPGSNAGTGQPLILKCGKCKLTRDTFFRAGNGELVRTGRTREHAGKAGARMGTTAYECECLVCGHVGWYRHRDAARRPLKTDPSSVPPRA